MNQSSAIDVFVAALKDLPPFENPLIPVYADLGQYQPVAGLAQKPLTLRVIRQHAQLLHDHADQAREASDVGCNDCGEFPLHHEPPARKIT